MNRAYSPFYTRYRRSWGNAHCYTHLSGGHEYPNINAMIRANLGRFRQKKRDSVIGSLKPAWILGAAMTHPNRLVYNSVGNAPGFGGA